MLPDAPEAEMPFGSPTPNVPPASIRNVADPEIMKAPQLSVAPFLTMIAVEAVMLPVTVIVSGPLIVMLLYVPPGRFPLPAEEKLTASSSAPISGVETSLLSPSKSVVTPATATPALDAGELTLDRCR